MPRFPDVAPSLAAVRGSAYSIRSAAPQGGEVYPLHVGDTWMEPAVGCRMQDLTVESHPGMHRYAPPQGLPALLDAIVERTRARTGAATERDDVLVAAGATGALGAVAGAIVAPGDEVLILAPFWPLIAGIVRSFHGVPVPVPLFGAVDDLDAALAALAARRTERTVALYLNTPNNPTGRTLPRPWVEAFAGWAARHGLWVVSDEVYEDYVYEGEHVYARPFAPERTFSAYSFSKGFGMAGNRCGYVIGPSAVMTEVRKVATHTFYSTPTASQLAGVEALTGAGLAWVEQAREAYAALGRYAAARLGVAPPQGSTFLFLDVAAHLDARCLRGFLEDAAAHGLLLAPGDSFGPYPTHVRVCFTSAEPERVKRGVDVLAGLLGR